MRTVPGLIRGRLPGVIETTSRLLAVLSALQSGGAVSGPDLAERLGVTVRTVRRDVERLRRLGYAIDSDVGSTGGYRLGSGGSAVPPLILDTEETVALAVCVHAAAGDSVVGVADAAARALAKLEVALPPASRSSATALAATTVRLPTGGDAVDHEVLLTVSAASRERERIRVVYRNANGRESEKRLEPYRVVNVGRRWYLVAHDLGPREWRTFRLDRFISVERTGHGADLVDPPDAADFVRTSITMAPYRYRARVRIAATTDEVAALIPPSVGMLEAIDERTTILSAGADDLDYFVLELGVLPYSIEIVEPAELREHFVTVAERLLAAACAHA